MRVFDQAGNESSASRSIRVDSQPPQSTFTSPADGSTTTVSGRFTLTGSSSDATSGLAAAEFSLDNGRTWQPLELDQSGSWSYTWDTTGVPNGRYPILARARDRAGNRESTARVTLVVANAPPHVELPNTWMIWESVPLSIHPRLIPLGGARLVISDPQGRWPARRFEYPPGQLPTEFLWDRRLGDGTLAPPGQYRVTLEAWDRFGNSGRATGTVLIPLPPTSVPSPVATPSPLLNNIEISTPRPSPTPQRETLETPSPQAALASTPVPHVPSPPASRSLTFWPALGLVGLLLALASASLSDPRPQALRRLGKTLDGIFGKHA